MCMLQKIRNLNIDRRYPLSILAATALIVVLDLMIVPIFRNQNLWGSYREAAVSHIIVGDIAFALGAGLVGLLVVSHLGLPIWWSHNDEHSSQISLIVIVLGASLVLINLIMYMTNLDQLASCSFLTMFAPKTAIALSLRAALTEEIFLRLFLFPAIAWVVMHFLKRELSLIIGGVVSSVYFGLIHPGFFLAFFVGLALVYIYYYKGLLPAMIVHFLADAAPFVYLAVIM
jgi:membrane protease YdiL (CAAX protease family)